MLKTKIQFADSSWNPVTGCYYSCEYCYARKIATRFAGCDETKDGKTTEYAVELDRPAHKSNGAAQKTVSPYPYGFTPTLHKYRLQELSARKYGETIFVCSMGDLFGEWVADEWIEAVFKACEENPSHRYLFLTKNPTRYLKLAESGKLPEKDNFWYGTTANKAGMPIFHSSAHHTFVSAEPLHGPIFTGKDGPADLVDWIIIGAETGRRKGKVIPKKEWFQSIVYEFQDRGKPVFMKNSLEPIWGDDLVRQLPWQPKSI